MTSLRAPTFGMLRPGDTSLGADALCCWNCVIARLWSERSPSHAADFARVQTMFSKDRAQVQPQIWDWDLRSTRRVGSPRPASEPGRRSDAVSLVSDAPTAQGGEQRLVDTGGQDGFRRIQRGEADRLCFPAHVGRRACYPLGDIETR